ncbi:hypothetical protein KCP73_24305 [Salmonella enterica subsp. enterica]|nr:hypothetical protein KCP73_24305 [Salmonella enterica subsp. enterica]
MRLNGAAISLIACRAVRLSGPTKRRTRRLTSLGDLCPRSVIPLPKYPALTGFVLRRRRSRPDRLSVAVYP